MPPDSGDGAFGRFAAQTRPSIEEALTLSLPAAQPRSPALSRAIADAALSPGKRLRPLAAVAAGEVVRAPRDASVAVGVAVELIHAASLVLDDLPSMDDALFIICRPALK
ncbi:MAG: polyprenyl synthetase family protein, partial [Thermoanaerobaculia bacterium]